LLGREKSRCYVTVKATGLSKTFSKAQVGVLGSVDCYGSTLRFSLSVVFTS
jgi:hypothetical protein